MIFYAVGGFIAVTSFVAFACIIVGANYERAINEWADNLPYGDDVHLPPDFHPSPLADEVQRNHG